MLVECHGIVEDEGMCVGRVPWYCGGGGNVCWSSAMVLWRRRECVLVECHGTVEEEVEQSALNFVSSRWKPECRWDVLGVLKNAPGWWRAVPYTRSAGEHSASSHQAVRVPSKTIGNSSIHLGPVRWALREAFNCRCILSTRPFACGW